MSAVRSVFQFLALAVPMVLLLSLLTSYTMDDENAPNQPTMQYTTCIMPFFLMGRRTFQNNYVRFQYEKWCAFI